MDRDIKSPLVLNQTNQFVINLSQTEKNKQVTSKQKRSCNNNRKNHNKELRNLSGQSSGKSVKVHEKWYVYIMILIVTSLLNKLQGWNKKPRTKKGLILHCSRYTMSSTLDVTRDTSAASHQKKNPAIRHKIFLNSSRENPHSHYN